MQLSTSIWLIGFIFFAVGTLICMNDVIFPYVKDFYHLTYFQATLIQWTFYFVYLPFPFLISAFVNRYGYKVAVISALFITISGCAIFYPSFALSSFGILLISIFIIATGIAVMNVAANSYAALLGPPDQSQLRINFVQVFSRLGYAVTPIIGSSLIKPQNNEPPNIYLPYFVVGGLFIIITIGMLWVKPTNIIPELTSKMNFKQVLHKSFHIRHLLFGSIAMFFYVGAEACTASFFISYIMHEGAVPESIDHAALCLTWFNVVAGIGGFAGIYLIKYFDTGKVVFYFSIILILLYSVCIFSPHLYFPYPIIIIGFFMSLMFPTIYGLAIDKLGNFTAHGAALVNVSVVGGAIMPPLQGLMADHYSVAISYIIPCACFVIIGIYGIWFAKPTDQYTMTD
ncbi:MAG: MFS transporter [Cytophagales bacterium]|nr:MFS transporter [Cytophagales bacterium]